MWTDTARKICVGSKAYVFKVTVHSIDERTEVPAVAETCRKGRCGDGTLIKCTVTVTTDRSCSLKSGVRHFNFLQQFLLCN
jgi:hypothetical protein